ncbi:MAG TPA: hypothetical protein VM469_05560 [Pseudoxanthomonas sp.]|nr:hypothetical protein [Pseudoxanthomonas sp.]
MTKKILFTCLAMAALAAMVLHLSTRHGVTRGNDDAKLKSRTRPPIETGGSHVSAQEAGHVPAGPMPPLQLEGRRLCISATKLEECQNELLQQHTVDLAKAYEATGEWAERSALPEMRAFEGASPLPPDRLRECSALVRSAPSVAPLWRAAAEKGSLSAMLNYAAGTAFNSDATLQDVDELRIYKQRAEQYAYQVARAGSFVAVVALASAMSPQEEIGPRPLLSQAVDTNQVEAMTLYRMADRAIGTNVKGKERVKDLISTRLLQLEALSSPQEIRQSWEALKRREAQWAPLHVPSTVDVVEALLLSRGEAPPPSEADCNSF